MNENSYQYIWRCGRCSNHFVNIIKTDGELKQEKKCPKCKSINSLTLTNDDIYIHCKICGNNNNHNYEENQPSY